MTAHGGLIVGSPVLHPKRFRPQLRRVLPHDPVSPHADDPTDGARGYGGGIRWGADKRARGAWLQSDPAVAPGLGVEAGASPSPLSRGCGVFPQKAWQALSGLPREAGERRPSARAGYTLDLDSWARLHADGHQEGVAVGYPRRGLKPGPRPRIAGLAEAKVIANYWRRPGPPACGNGAAGFGDARGQNTCEARGLHCLFVAKRTQQGPALCRQGNESGQPPEVAGGSVQAVALERPGRRWIGGRPRGAERPQAGGQTLFAGAGYRFPALVTHLPRSVDALAVGRRYNGRADLENRLRERGDPLGIQRRGVDKFGGTEALPHLAIAAYTLGGRLQRRRGQLEKCEWNTLRGRLFARAAVGSRRGGKSTLKLAVRGEEARRWGREIPAKRTAPPNCHAVAPLQA